MKVSTLFVLRMGPRITVVWRPRIRIPNSRIMAKAISTELEAAKRDGRIFNYRWAVERFQIQSQKMRLDDAEAAELFEIVSKAMKEETNFDDFPRG
jgi:hypothetical protein